MKCILCSINLSSDEAIINDDQIFCIQCNDVNDFAKDIKKEKKETIKIKEMKLLGAISTMPDKALKTENYIKCPKCKNKFSTKICNCGYKNPL